MDMHIYKPSRERLQAARERLNKRDKTRGTPEERMRHQLEVYLDMKEFQDRVYAHLHGYLQTLLNAHIEEEDDDMKNEKVNEHELQFKKAEEEFRVKAYREDLESLARLKARSLAMPRPELSRDEISAIKRGIMNQFVYICSALIYMTEDERSQIVEEIREDMPELFRDYMRDLLNSL